MGCRGGHVIRENGIDTYLYDPYFGADILPDILYGLEDTLDMLSRAKENNFLCDEEGGVLVDIDAKLMMFWGSDLLLDNVPLIPFIVDFMQTVTWQGWDIRHAKWGTFSMKQHLGIAKYPTKIQRPSKEQREYHLNWWLRVDQSNTEYGEEECTVISHRTSDGRLLHYSVAEDLEDTLRLGEDLLGILENRKTVKLSHQRDVFDCLHIDEIHRTIHVFWGYPLCSGNNLMYRMDMYWEGWQAKWIDDGYPGYLKLIGCEDPSLLFTREEATDKVFKLFTNPIERGLTALEESDQTDLEKEQGIARWSKRIAFVAELKRQWLEKYNA